MDLNGTSSSSSDEEPAAKKHRPVLGTKTACDSFHVEMESVLRHNKQSVKQKLKCEKKTVKKKKTEKKISNCVICLANLSHPRAQPSACEHEFHPECLSTWAETSNTCPIDRSKFHSIKVSGNTGQVISTREVQTPPNLEEDDITGEEEEELESNLDPSPCPICLSSDEQDEMIYCFECCTGFHQNCLQSPQIQVDYWMCMTCVQEENGRCRICLSMDFEEGTAYCATCNGAYHIKCIEPPSLPTRDWICSLCKEATAKEATANEET